jgi:hypothetical protein
MELSKRSLIQRTKNKENFWLHFGGHPNDGHDIIYLSLPMGLWGDLSRGLEGLHE